MVHKLVLPRLAGDGYPQFTDALLRPRSTDIADSTQGIAAEAHRSPQNHMIDMPVTVAIDGKDVRVLVICERTA
jgi:hypothetical protein